MFENIRISLKQGVQYIKNVKSARVNAKFRGFPEIGTADIDDSLREFNCPADAMNKAPLSIDMGKCNFCGACERELGSETIRFTNEHRLAADKRGKLIVSCGSSYDEFERSSIVTRNEIKKMFGRSLKLRSVSAGGCNGCEMELNASSNVNFDIGRFGIDIVASPRHADGIIITGPITENMAFALEETYESTPNPKIIILMGSCAISGGLFARSEAVRRDFLDKRQPDLYLPGCPVHPLTLINGILRFLGK